jgi:hypothetical protein
LTALYVPGVEETDQKKLIRSQQLVAGATSTNTTNIATNTASIATNTAAIAALNAATYVNSIAGNSGAFTLSTGLTNSVNDLRLSLLNATLQTNLSNPTGTTSATGVMMGLGGVAKLTPVYSTRIKIQFIGAQANSTANNSITVKAFFGTGTAPSNAAAITGTQVGNNMVTAQNTAANQSSFTQGGIITGLTPGTAYWFDLSLAVGAGTGTLSSLSFNAMEF